MQRFKHSALQKPIRRLRASDQLCIDGYRTVSRRALTLSVGEVEEQTQGEQQRQQQQRGSGPVHGGTAWHQHALAAWVALAHRAL